MGKNTDTGLQKFDIRRLNVGANEEEISGPEGSGCRGEKFRGKPLVVRRNHPD